MRLIDADALKKAIEHYQNKRYRNREEDFAIRDAFKRAIIIIDDAPTVETKECPYNCETCARKMICELGKEMERPQGEWIEQKNYPFCYECNQCGTENTHKANFCEYCGADMRGGKE